MPSTSQIHSIIWWNFVSSLEMSSTKNSELHLQKFDVDSHKAFPSACGAICKYHSMEKLCFSKA